MNVIVQEWQRTKDKILDAAMLPVRELLPTALVEQWCRDAGYAWRDRVLGPMVTMLACVWKHLHARVLSARDVEDAIAEWAASTSSCGRSGSDFCQARKRLPKTIFRRAFEHVGGLASQTHAHVFQSLSVWLVDGSSIRLPNTRAQVARYGRVSGGGKSWSIFPVARLLLLVCAGSGAVLKLLVSPFYKSEQELFLELIEQLPAGGLLVGDCAFGSFLNCCRVQMRDSHLLTRLRADRQGKEVERLGSGDKIAEWHRPQPCNSAFPEWLSECPPKIYVRVLERCVRRRGYRDQNLILVTTLLDPQVYPAEELVALYLKRWKIETVLRTLKSDYGIERMSGQTPDVAEKELFSAVLAYNCIMALICQSDAPPERVSPMRAKHIVMRCADEMSRASTLTLVFSFRKMLKSLASALRRPQERGPQPRALLRTHSDYPALKGSRKDWQRKYLVA